jgi:hypothetical protein
MDRTLLRWVAAWRDGRRRHREGLAASKRLGSDPAAWAQVFRRADWTPPPAGHPGRCGQCGARLELAARQCPQCKAGWKPNMRRVDLYRQIAIYSSALLVSGGSGYLGSEWVRRCFDAVRARGDKINPEMIDTLASFTWLFCGVLVMIGLTYAIERLAPAGHWRKPRAEPRQGGERRRKDAPR